MRQRSFPSVFVSHGAPTLALESGPANTFLRGLGSALGTPEAVLCISAHWESDIPVTSLSPEPQTIWDFYGFPEELYRLRYPAPGAPRLAASAAALLRESGVECREHADRGLDHGAWVPLMLMYPDANIPVTQLSVSTRRGPLFHHRLGRILEPLRHSGILILGSGGAVHNLGTVDFGSGAIAPWAAEFDNWLNDRLMRGETGELLDYRTKAPFGPQAHPTEEHFLPLFVAAGAGGSGAGAATLHRSFSFSTLSMAAYAFDS